MPQQTHALRFSGSEVAKTYLADVTHEPEREQAVLRLLAERAPGLAPEPLALTQESGRWTLRMTRLPGEALDGPLTEARRRALGVAVRRLHAVAPPDDLPVRILPAGEFLALVRDRLDEIDRTLLPAEAVEAYDAGQGWAGTVTLPEARTDVVGLADGNLANAVWDGEVCRLVDFEDAGRSDRAWEVADLVEHVSVRVHARVDAETLACDCGLPADDVGRWSAYRPVFAVFWLLMLVPGAPAHHRNPPGTLADQAAHVLDLLG